MPPAKFTIWYNKAYQEVGMRPDTRYRHIIFPKSFYTKIVNLSKEKVHDFVFIGGLKTDNLTFKNRKWILPFIDKHFNENSYLQFTDNKTKRKYVTKGNFDYTISKSGFVPKENLKNGKVNYFDIKYFENMCKSKFCLCPAGDVNWSYRFFESLICKTIPIVDKESETYRKSYEKEIGYKYYLTTSPEFVYREDWVEHNYNLFMKYHTLSDFSNKPEINYNDERLYKKSKKINVFNIRYSS